MKLFGIRRRALWTGVSCWLVPGSAAACAMCFNASQEAREAYYVTTALMIAVPFTLAGGFGLWLRRLSRGRTRPDACAPATRHG